MRVITHGLWQYNNAAVWEALRGTGTPYFVVPHGMLDPAFKRAYPVKHFKKQVYWMLRERQVLRDAAAVVFTCEEERRLAGGTFIPYICKEKVIPLPGSRLPPQNTLAQRTQFLERNSPITWTNESCCSLGGSTIKKAATC